MFSARKVSPKTIRNAYSVNNTQQAYYVSRLPSISPVKLNVVDEANFSVYPHNQMLLPAPKHKRLINRNLKDEALFNTNKSLVTKHNLNITGNDESQLKLRRPQFLAKDHEDLQEEIIQLKQKCNKFKEQNKLLLSKVRIMEGTMQNFNQSNNAMLSKNPSFNDTQFQEVNSPKVKLLTDKYQEIKKKLQEKQQEIDSFKKNNRTSRIQELEVEVQSYQLETFRLLKIIKQFNKISKVEITNDRTVTNQSGVLNNNNLEIIQQQENQAQLVQLLSGQLIEEEMKTKEINRKLKQISVKYKNKKNAELRWELSQLTQQKSQLTGSLQESIIEVSELKKGIEQRKRQRSDIINQLEATVFKQKIQLEQMNKQYQNLQDLFQKQNKQFREKLEMENQIQMKNSQANNKKESDFTKQLELNKTIEVHRQQEAEQVIGQNIDEDPLVTLQDNEIKEQQDQTIQAEVEKKVSKESLETYEKQDSFVLQQNDTVSNHGSSKLKSQQTISLMKQNDAIDESQFNTIERRNNYLQKLKNQRLPKVNGYDVENLGRLLRYKLMVKNVKYLELDNLLIDEGMLQRGEGTIQEIIEKLHAYQNEVIIILFSEPFALHSDEQKVILARYLVEDNSQDFINYDDEQTTDIHIIKSVFKKTIGRYTLFTEQDLVQLRVELSQVSLLSFYINQMFQKFRLSIMDNMILYTQKKKNLLKNQCEQEDWLAVLRVCDLNFSSRQQEYLNYLIYLQNGQLQIMNYQKLLEHLDQAEIRRDSAKQSRQNSQINDTL